MDPDRDLNVESSGQIKSKVRIKGLYSCASLLNCATDIDDSRGILSTQKGIAIKLLLPRTHEQIGCKTRFQIIFKQS